MARVSAYLIDSIALIVVLLICFAIAGGYLLAADEQSNGDLPNSAYYTFTGILLGGTIAVWTLVNLFLLQRRGQTLGMYILAIRVASDDGVAPTFRQLAQRWFGLHPLLFHPLLLLPWLVLLFVLASINANVVILGIALGFVLLCVVAPVVALATILIDPQHRALHDRLSHTVVLELS
jgi:uncharacterized RDD family membrane protein YckC